MQTEFSDNFLLAFLGLTMEANTINSDQTAPKRAV